MFKTPKLQELFEKQLTRKEFLQVVGLMILSLIGVSGMLSNVNKSLGGGTNAPSDDYGASSYGG